MTLTKTLGLHLFISKAFPRIGILIVSVTLFGRVAMIELNLGDTSLDLILAAQGWRIRGDRVYSFNGSWVGEFELTPSGLYKVRLDKAYVVVVLAGMSI